MMQDLTKNFDGKTHLEPPDPTPWHLQDMGPILARWPMLLKYDAASGELWRRYVIETAKYPELLDRREYVAGKPRGNGNYVRIDGLTVSAARLVWLLHHGAWPDGAVQRRDDDPFNDRIENLYLRQKEDVKRGRPRLRPPGVSKLFDEWQAYGDLGRGRRKYLGRFQTVEEAARARAAWDAANDLV